MKRYVVLGVNENPKYLYYLPLVCWAWRSFGYESIIFYTGEKEDTKVFDLVFPELSDFRDRIKFVDRIDGYKTETVAQFARLYASSFIDGALMTTDVDMLPLTNYWNISSVWNQYSVYCFGRDLSKEHQPICYISAYSGHWAEFMKIKANSDYNYLIKRDLDSMDRKTNPWLWDQDLVTKNLNKYTARKKYIDRGTDKRTGYPIGRVDRSHWTLDHKVLIDAHLPHDILTNEKSFHNVMQLLHTVWPKEDWKWFLQYTKEFKKLL